MYELFVKDKVNMKLAMVLSEHSPLKTNLINSWYQVL